ncbi:TIGR04282 family arsenosugar biosynthesis glycosyltransferase [Desulfobacterota bacterium M19]
MELIKGGLLTYSAEDAIIIFIRSPVPGLVKTRLIPALGAQGAADCQRRMSEQTVRRVRELKRYRTIDIQIHYTGGKTEMMAAWLGDDLNYHPQRGNDIGCRMTAAFQQAFAAGSRRIILVGSDCPALTAAILHSALNKLKRLDLVLGPAMDGGYYLIGLNRPCPTLFTEISWGTSKVFAETLKKAEEQSLSIGHTDTLYDIDRPEDLRHFHNYTNP